VTALLTSIVATAAMFGIIVYVGRHRSPGTPLTWGEAFVAAVFVFAFLLLIYGVLPNQWLQYADSKLKWRSDKIGIPMGPLHYLPNVPNEHQTGKVLWFIPVAKNCLWPNGVTFFGRGKIIVTAQVLRDVIAAVLYIVLLGGQGFAWSWWQKRGQKKPAMAELPTSAYGRPLVREV
jgi:hypothetical protein